MQSAANSEQQSSRASSAQAMVNAVFALIMASLFLVGFFGFAVWYVVNSIEDKTALTIVFCFIGLVALSAVFGTVGIGVWYFRSLGGSLVQHQADGVASLQNAFVQLVAETRRTNERNAELITEIRTAKQLPAASSTPVTTGSGTFVINDRTRPISHAAQPAQPAGWLYQLPDGRKVRGDLIEAIVDHQFDDYDSKRYPDFRSYLHEFVTFGHATYRSAIDALEREGVCDGAGKFRVTQDEAWRIVALMQARARVPAEAK
jgi:hypothetical protein